MVYSIQKYTILTNALVVNTHRKNTTSYTYHGDDASAGALADNKVLQGIHVHASAHATLDGREATKKHEEKHKTIRNREYSKMLNDTRLIL